jgi:Ca2+-binding EF-hand superfamily protein
MTDDELREMIEEADPSGKGGVDETAFKDIMGAAGLLEGPDT